MTLQEMCEKDQLIMKCLKICEISHILAKTNKGDLTMKLIFEEKDYKFFLDAVPMEDKENKKLIKLFEGILYQNEEYIKREFLESELSDIRLDIKELKTEDEVLPQYPIRGQVRAVEVPDITTATDNTAKIIETNGGTN